MLNGRYDSVFYSACAVSGYSGKSKVRELHISFGSQQVVVDPRAFFNEIRGVRTLDLNNWR